MMSMITDYQPTYRQFNIDYGSRLKEEPWRCIACICDCQVDIGGMGVFENRKQVIDGA